MVDPLGLDLIPLQARRTHPRRGDEQLLTTYILDDILTRRRPDDAIAVLAVTTADLWPGENNFVFGQASRTERVGVWSLLRMSVSMPRGWLGLDGRRLQGDDD